MIRSLDHSTVPADVGHRGEGVKHLGPGDPGDAVHAEGGELPGGESLDQIWILAGVQEGVEGGLVSGKR